VVDLDGTLVNADTLWLAFGKLALFKPYRAIWAVAQIPLGRARFKQAVANGLVLDVSKLPYRRNLLEMVKAERARGRRIILATGADRSCAIRVANHLQCFDVILASDGEKNLTGTRKAAAIETLFGGGPFIYAGDSRDDLAVWRKSAGAILVGASRSCSLEVERAGIPVCLNFPPVR